ncbi:hypothetical protein PanWU01x14_114620 [Parasponia andersonii]|uniref:Uncharacterized protein n=1 Tax=Parasponia andersonii TaxID=3476 RepID=A0A2P5CXE4_PARAD|nr:hypothetical protein PanWU01x14_114620 [Parasponia andersonii]
MCDQNKTSVNIEYPSTNFKVKSPPDLAHRRAGVEHSWRSSKSMEAHSHPPPNELWFVSTRKRWISMSFPSTCQPDS